MTDQPPEGFPALDAPDAVWFAYFDTWATPEDYQTYMKFSGSQGALIRYMKAKGGKAQFPSERMEVTSVRLPAALLDRLEQEGRSMPGGRSTVIRTALERYFQAGNAA